MSTAAESPAPSRSSCLPRFGCLVLVGLPILFLLMMAGIGIGVTHLTITILFGWISFILDVWPRITLNWGSIFTGIFCFGVILYFGHWFLDWLSRGVASARGKSFHWPLKWTACGLGAIALFFLIGMAVAGAAHQIGWIAESDEPLYEIRPKTLRLHMEISQVDSTIAACFKATNTVQSFRTNISQTMKEMWDRSSHPPDLQSFHLLMLVNSNSLVDGVLIFPRDKETRQRWGGDYEAASESPHHMRPDELTIFIEANQSNLVAF